MPLTDTAVRNASAKEKQYTLYDREGLFLLVLSNGSKLWRWKYRVHGREKRISLGTYPKVSLKAARDKRDELQADLKKGVDPAAAKKNEKAEALTQAETFEAVAREWHGKFSRDWTAVHAERIMRRFERNIFPYIGSRPIKDVTAPELLAVVRRIEDRGKIETSHRALQNCGQVFRYAVASGKAVRDPSGDLRGALPPVKEKHFASITDPKEVAKLLRALDGYTGSFVTQCALKLTPLLFVRPGELRQAEWAEIDLDAGEWRIPGVKMKMRDPHVVPLSRQAVEVLRELHPLTGGGRYVFPSERTTARCMSENTINAALRRLGYSKDEMTAHGFRSMASTLLNEQGWNPDAIERQLAHAERNSVRRAYNFAEHLPERRRMMQAWADYLDALRAGGKVIPLHRATGGE